MPVRQRQFSHALLERYTQYVLFQDDEQSLKPERQPKRVHNNLVESVITDYDLSLEGKQVTEEEYWDKYYTDTPYEWNNGILEVKPLSDFRSNLLRLWFEALLHEFRNMRNNFQQISYEIGFNMHLRKGKSIRKPDIGFVGPKSLKMQEDECTYKGIFDLCVEFLSDSKPSEVKRDTEQKFKEYEEAGVKDFFILDRNKTHTAFYRLKNDRYEKLDPSDGIIRSEVLKDFQFRIKHLYSRPHLDSLMDDPVYQHYVKRDKRMAEKKVEIEKRRVDDEKKRADEKEQLLFKEKERSEAYRKKLAELGIII